MTSVAGNAFRAVKPHIPLIRFRKGGLEELAKAANVMATPEPVAPAAAAPAPTVAPVLEEWQLPFRYRRATISQEEIDYINRGGPA